MRHVAQHFYNVIVCLASYCGGGSCEHARGNNCCALCCMGGWGTGSICLQASGWINSTGVASTGIICKVSWASERRSSVMNGMEWVACLKGCFHVAWCGEAETWGLVEEPDLVFAAWYLVLGTWLEEPDLVFGALSASLVSSFLCIWSTHMVRLSMHNWEFCTAHILLQIFISCHSVHNWRTQLNVQLQNTHL